MGHRQGDSFAPAFGGTLPGPGGRDKGQSWRHDRHVISLQCEVVWGCVMRMDRIKPGQPPAEVTADGDRDIALRMSDKAEAVAAFLKALSHEGRLMILCHLAAGEKSVTELERLLGQRQAAVSQQLARLRLEGMVTTRREGKAIHYSLASGKVRAILRLLPELGKAA